jgi:hypothetical protein
MLLPLVLFPSSKKKIGFSQTVFYHKEFIVVNRMFLLFSSPVVSTTGFQGSAVK